MAMTYSNLVDAKTNTESLAYWVNATNLPTAALLTDAQAFIYSQLRVREMRSSQGMEISPGMSQQSFPADFLDPIELLDNRGTKIRLFEETMLMRSRATDSAGVLQSGLISRYAIFDEQFQFDCKSSETTTVYFKLLYYRLPAPLSVSNQTNFLTTRYPHLLRQTLISMAHAFRGDVEMEKSAMAKAVAYIQSANEEGDLSRRGADYPVEDMRDG